MALKSVLKLTFCEAYRCHRRSVRPISLLDACYHGSSNTAFPTDIKALTISTPNAISDLGPAFQKYNEEQFVTVKLPGSSQQVIISSHSSLGDGRYYDVESSSSFVFDHTTQVRETQSGDGTGCIITTCRKLVLSKAM